MLYNRVSIYMSIYVIIYISYPFISPIIFHISHYPHPDFSVTAPERTQCNPTANRTFLEIDPWHPWPPRVFRTPNNLWSPFNLYIYIIYPIFNGDLMGLNGTYITMDITMIFLSHEKSPWRNTSMINILPFQIIVTLYPKNTSFQKVRLDP